MLTVWIYFVWAMNVFIYFQTTEKVGAEKNNWALFCSDNLRVLLVKGYWCVEIELNNETGFR